MATLIPIKVVGLCLGRHHSLLRCGSLQLPTFSLHMHFIRISSFLDAPAAPDPVVSSSSTAIVILNKTRPQPNPVQMRYYAPVFFFSVIHLLQCQPTMLFYTMQPLSCLLPLKWSIIQSQQHFILCLTLLLLCVSASAGCCDPFRCSPLGSLAFPRPYLLSFIPLDHNNGQPFRLL